MTDWHIPTARNELRDRIETAILNEAPVWTVEFSNGEDAPVCSVSDAAVVATRVLTAWLRDQAAEQWERAKTHAWEPSRQMSTIRAMWLTERADEFADPDEKQTTGDSR